MKKVCVICVTYNRKEYLSKLLSALQHQDYKIDSVIIVDNCSSDQTNEMLQEKGYVTKAEYDEVHYHENQNIKFYYYRSSRNMGGAGGFKECFKIATTLDVDYYWVMDDDVLPQSTCLSKLLLNQNDQNKITIPCRSDENFKDRIVTKIDMKSLFKGVANRKEYYNFDVSNNIAVVDMPFEGPLINAELAKRVGLPNDEYFIYYDDTDYAWRAKQYTNILYVHDAILNKQIIPIKSKDKNISWKEYYLLRNTIYFDRKYGENFGVRYIRPILIWISLIFKNIISLNFKNLPKVNKAIFDGYVGKMGKSVEPGAF